MNLLVISVASLISGFLYRLGGTGGAWWKNTKIRDLGCPLVSMITLMYIGVSAEAWQWVLYFCLSFASMTTYHKWLNNIFKTATDDVYWYSWALTGFCYGLPLLLLIPVKIALFRAGLLAICTMFWSEEVRIDWLEEGGRGFLYCFSLILIT